MEVTTTAGDQAAAAFITETGWTDFPDDVREKAKMCLMDNLSATVSGTQAKISDIASAFAVKIFPDSEASILLKNRRSSAAGAAFANGSAANGLDTDDSARYSFGHAGAQLFPTALAVAESRGLSGEDLLTAMIIGYEIAHRMGRCWHDDHEVYQACGSWGSPSCAAVAARLLGLDTLQTRHALGIADYHAPNLPIMRDIAHPAMVKHGIGWAALTGILSAELASEGFTGIPSYLSFDKYGSWVEDIGRRYIMLDGVSWKAQGYACCGWAHAAVEGAKTLMDKFRFTPEDIRSIHIITFKESAALGKKLPKSTEEAQFNLAWPVAAMLVYGEVGPSQTLECSLHDEKIRNLVEKISIEESEELNELCRKFERGDPEGRFASEVILALNNGKEYSSGLVGGGLQFPQPGWDRTVMERKFHWLVAPLLGRKLSTGISEMLWNFDSVGDVNELTVLLAEIP